MKLKKLDRLTDKVEQSHEILDQIESLEAFAMLASKSAIITVVIGDGQALSVDELFTASEVEVKINDRIRKLRAEFKEI